jgi:hypothetical protein
MTSWNRSNGDLKRPRFHNDKSPQEQWTRTIPPIQVTQEMYEAVQELSTASEHEFGGKASAVIREAIEEFIDKYGVPTGTPRMTLYSQMKAFRDNWVEEIIANQILESFGVIENTLDRWTRGGNSEMIIETFQRLLDSMNMLPPEWQKTLKEYAKDSRAANQAMEFAMADVEVNSKKRKALEIVHSVLYE